jgi:uncharacterized membrane protein (DUF4010 family)
METTLFTPDLPTLQRLALALALGLFVGLEREHRRKEAGLRTFGFVSVLGGLGGVAGGSFGLLAVALVGVLVVLLNVDTLRTEGKSELTTSAALLVMGFTGLLAGLGHTFTPTALSILTAALLAWKRPLAGFSRALTDLELRSAILLAILAFVVYPILPQGSVDRWNLIVPRTAWITVILISAFGFVNYILLKVYGDRGLVLSGFFGGFVNSKVASVELSTRAHELGDQLTDSAYRGIILSNGSMLIRNIVIIGVFAPAAIVTMSLPMALMLIGIAIAVFVPDASLFNGTRKSAEKLHSFQSPFSIKSALKFGIIFLVLQVVSTLALRNLGQAGLYAVALIGGFVSSASAVASIATLVTQEEITSSVAALGVVLASVSSIVSCVPFISRFGKTPVLTRRVSITLGVITLLGVIGGIVPFILSR